MAIENTGSFGNPLHHFVFRKTPLHGHAAVLFACCLLYCSLLYNTVEAHSEDEDSLHFSHPLIAESPSPDTKVRFDYFFQDINGKGETAKEHSFRVEAEYAFHRSFSIEVDFPYTILDPDNHPSTSHLGSASLDFKFANFAFEEHGLLLGYGIGFAFPTGDDKTGIGSGHLFEIEPFLNAGYMRGKLETVVFVSFGIPTNQDPGEEVETELGHNLSLLYHISPRVSALLELGGETVLSGEEDGATIVNLTPGVKFQPRKYPGLQFGAGLSFPLSQTKGFDTQAILSAFYHF